MFNLGGSHHTDTSAGNVHGVIRMTMGARCQFGMGGVGWEYKEVNLKCMITSINKIKRIQSGGIWTGVVILGREKHERSLLIL